MHRATCLAATLTNTAFDESRGWRDRHGRGGRYPGNSGDGGPALSALMSPPFGIAIDREGTIYFSDFRNHRVRKFTPEGTIATVAGTGEPGLWRRRRSGYRARLHAPTGLAFDNAGNLFIGDNKNNRIRRVATDGFHYYCRWYRCRGFQW